jgi:hypothetical protein
VVDGVLFGAKDFGFCTVQMFSASVAPALIMLNAHSLPGIWRGLSLLMALRAAFGALRILGGFGPFKALRRGFASWPLPPAVVRPVVSATGAVSAITSGAEAGAEIEVGTAPGARARDTAGSGGDDTSSPAGTAHTTSPSPSAETTERGGGPVWHWCRREARKALRDADEG